MILKYITCLVLFAVLDFVWLGYVMKDFNLAQLRDIGRIENGQFDVALVPAAFAYVLMAAAVVWFSLPHATTNLSALLWGAALGIVVYGIFDMTNLAILRNYPLPFAMADMAWGTFLFGLVNFLVGRVIFKS